MHLALHLLELDGRRRNLDGHRHARRIRPGIEERRTHGGGDSAGRGGHGAALQRLFNRVARQHVARFHVAVARPGTHGSAGLVHFDLEGVATAFDGLWRRVADNVVLILLLADLLHAAEQIVRIGDYEPPGAIRQQVHHLLIVGGAGRKAGNVHARRIVVGVVGVVGIVGIIRPAVGVRVGVGIGAAARGAGAAGVGAPGGAAPRPRIAPGVATGAAARGAAAGRPRVAAGAATTTAAGTAAALLRLGGG